MRIGLDLFINKGGTRENYQEEGARSNVRQQLAGPGLATGRSGQYNEGQGGAVMVVMMMTTALILEITAMVDSKS